MHLHSTTGARYPSTARHRSSCLLCPCLDIYKLSHNHLAASFEKQDEGKMEQKGTCQSLW